MREFGGPAQNKSMRRARNRIPLVPAPVKGIGKLKSLDVGNLNFQKSPFSFSFKYPTSRLPIQSD
jgi:hypothetical protein